MAEARTKLELTVEKMVYGGEGLARVDGRVAFTRFVLPGERVAAEVESERGGVLRTRITALREPSAERVAPPCPYFARCGGCHYQHAPYPRQLEIKRGILLETLRRVGKFDPPDEVAVVAGEPWGYRNRSQFHIQAGRLGYLEAGSHKLCAIEECPISSPKINELILVLNRMLRDPRWPKFVRSLEVFTDESQVQLNVLETERPVARRFFEWCAGEMPGLVEGALDYHGYRVSPQTFFQVNRFLVARLVEEAVADAGGDTALDLYAGAGLFSVALARRFRTVTAVESGSSAIRDLQFNAERAGVQVYAEQNTADGHLQGLDAAPDFVLLDPPRAGMGKTVVRRLAELKPARVSVVACDPATLARDLTGLLASGYRIQRLSLVDLFPQTYHMETVVHLVA